MPKSKLQYWKPKLLRNRERDMQNIALLEEEGWKVLVIWECELKDLDVLTVKIQCFLDA